MDKSNKIISKKAINLSSIKAILNLKQLFSFLDTKKKLYMIINSKYYQKKLGINLETYKKQSGKYKIGSKNGFGKEFSLETNKLIFEGEYINNRRNGKGKEYYKEGHLKLVGEYLKGNLIKAKEFYFNGKIKFEGNYLNRKRHGLGVMYNFYGDLIFKGEYANGERNGEGKEYYDKNKLYFEGNYLNGERNGIGKECDEDGTLIYEGNYLNGKNME